MKSRLIGLPGTGRLRGQPETRHMKCRSSSGSKAGLIEQSSERSRGCPFQRPRQGGGSLA